MCYHVNNKQNCPYNPCWDAHDKSEIRQPEDPLSEENLKLAELICISLNVDNISTMSSGDSFELNKMLEGDDSDQEDNFLENNLKDAQEFKSAFSNGGLMDPFLSSKALGNDQIGKKDTEGSSNSN